MSKRKTAAKRKSTRKSTSAKKSKSAKKRPAKPLSPAQKAWRVTWALRGQLKSEQMSYLRVGGMLVKVRDGKMYADLGHPTIEDYADKQLKLGKASLYRYLQIYDWVSKSHPQWLNPKRGQFIPDLSDCFNLMWIEGELEKPDLDPKKRAALEQLKAKGEAGKLRDSEVRAFRKQEKTGKDPLESFLSKLRLLRKRGAELASMPPEVINHLDAAIDTLKNHNVVKLAGFDMSDQSIKTAWRRQNAWA